MSLLGFIPWEVQLATGLIALAGVLGLVARLFGTDVARVAAVWGAAALGVLVLASRAFQKGQSYEIDRADKAADAVIGKARAARERAERDALDGRLRDDDGFKRRD